MSLYEGALEEGKNPIEGLKAGFILRLNKADDNDEF